MSKLDSYKPVEVPEFVAETVPLPPINHKVEQIVRGIYWGLGDKGNTFNVVAGKGAAQLAFDGNGYIDIGIADHRGYRFNPETNTVLIMMGYHPTAVLLHLTRMSLNGKPVVAIKDDRLVALHGAVVAAAHDVAFKWDDIKAVEVKGKIQYRVVGHPLLGNYRRYGKPEHFA